MGEISAVIASIRPCSRLALSSCAGGRRTRGGQLRPRTTRPSPTAVAKLIGTVGSTDDPDAYEINLTTEDGAVVTTTLPPREYMLEINDLSTIHNFHLGGPRAAVDMATDVAGTGEKRAVVVLQEGESYSYICDAHPTTMNVTFSIHGRIRTQN